MPPLGVVSKAKVGQLRGDVRAKSGEALLPTMRRARGDAFRERNDQEGKGGKRGRLGRGVKKAAAGGRLELRSRPASRNISIRLASKIGQQGRRHSEASGRSAAESLAGEDAIDEFSNKARKGFAADRKADVESALKSDEGPKRL